MILWNSKAKTKWEVAFAFFTFLKQNNQKKKLTYALNIIDHHIVLGLLHYCLLGYVVNCCIYKCEITNHSRVFLKSPFLQLPIFQVNFLGN